MKTHTTLLVGVGSSHGDDQIGWEVAKYIQSLNVPRVMVRLARTPSDILHWLESVESLVICDACRGAGKVGSVNYWTWPTSQLETLRWSGTHNISLPSVLALAEELGILPERVSISAVEVDSSQPGDAISTVGQSAIASAVDSITAHLGIKLEHRRSPDA